MKVTVYLDTSLRKITDQSRIDIDIRQGAIVREVIKVLNLADGEVGLVVRNSKIIFESTIVEGNDNLELYPVMGGG